MWKSFYWEADMTDEFQSLPLENRMFIRMPITHKDRSSPHAEMAHIILKATSRT
jgi:hypothetical protein